MIFTGYSLYTIVTCVFYYLCWCSDPYLDQDQRHPHPPTPVLFRGVIPYFDNHM